MENKKEITVIAEITALPGFENEIVDLIIMQTKASLQEDGVIYFSPNEAVGEKGKFIFFEVFRSEEDFKYHMGTDHSKAFFNGIIGKVEGDKVKPTFLENVAID